MCEALCAGEGKGEVPIRYVKCICMHCSLGRERRWGDILGVRSGIGMKVVKNS